MKVQTIVVGVDGSSHARRALEVAIDHVAADGVVHVVTALDRATRAEIERLVQQLPEEFRHLDIESTPRGYLTDAERTLEQRGVRHVGHFVEGHPAAAILDVAEEVDADLIVLGKRGLGRLERFVQGSVSARVASHAPASVMLVHDAAA